MSAKNPLEIRLLGDLEVRAGGKVSSLPQSKKTRALLGYLVLSGRAQRRERLCSLFWDVTDDRRGALRWSLSKIRSILGGATHLVSEGDSVRFERAEAWVDVLAVREAMSPGLDSLSTDRLAELSRSYRGELLERLDLPDFHEYQAWCAAQREQSRREHVGILRLLVSRLEETPEQALPYARELSQVDALDEQAHVTLLRLLLAAGRDIEAEQYLESAKRLLGALPGRSSGVLESVWRDRASVQRVPSGGSAVPAPPRSRGVGQEDVAPQSRAQLDAPLVGRDDVLVRLDALLERVSGKGHPLGVLVTGQPGIGKSRIGRAFLERVRGEKGRTLWGRAFETENAHPYAIWLDACRNLPRTSQGDSFGRDLVSLLSHAPADDRKSREELFGAVAARIEAFLGDAPALLLAFDDVQWCDESSTELLHYVLRVGHGRRILVMLFARSGELLDNAAVMRLVRSLRRERMLEEMSLEALSFDATLALVRGRVPEAAASEIVERSGGNPLFALELARTWGEHPTEGAPESLAALVRDRVDRLDLGAADVLRWAAVVGNRFDPRRLEGLSSLTMSQLIEHLGTLEQHQLLVVDTGGNYAFTHDLVRAVVYADLSEPRRRLMHLCAARALESQVEKHESLAQELAHHAGLAGDPALAARASLRAATHCVHLFASGEASAFARRGLVHAEALGERERIPMTIDLIDVLHRARPPERRDLAAAELEALGARALELGLLAHARRAFHNVSYLRWESGSWSDAERYVLEAERVSRSTDERERMIALAEAGRCLAMLERDLPQAEAMLIEAQVLCRRLGYEPGPVADAVGLLRLHEGQLEEADGLFRRARASAHTERDASEEFQALEHLVLLELARGRHDEVRALAAELSFLALKFREGSELPFAQALRALGGYARDLKENERPLTEAIDALRRADAKHRLALTLTRAACLDLDAGRHTLAIERAREALVAARLLDRPSEVALALGVMACSTREIGDEASAAKTRSELRVVDLRKVSADVRGWLVARALVNTPEKTWSV